MPVPSRAEAWVREIAVAYVDAHEAIPFGPLARADVTEGTLFHLAPLVCLKLRGIAASKVTLKRATEAALTSYVAMTSRDDPHDLSNPLLAFAFCYIAAHFGLDLVNEATASRTLDYVARHTKQLSQKIDALLGGP